MPAERDDEGLALFDDSPADGASVPPRRRPRRRGLTVALVVLLALPLALAGVAAWYLGSVRNAVDEVPRETLMPSGDRPTALSQEPTAAGRQAPQVFLVLGSDARDEVEGARSDTIMLAYLPGDRRSVYLVSFPRDLWVTIPGHGENKIEAAFDLGGAPLAVATVEQLLGVRMDHTALISFEGFVGLTNTLGGVQVVNRHPGSWDGYDFPAGTITVQGEQALAYVRERKDLPGGDLDRNDRQRGVAKAIITKALSAGVVGNPVKFAEVMAALKQFLVLDEGLSTTVLQDTVMGLKITSGSDVVTLGAPLGRSDWSEDGQWIWRNDPAKMAQLAEAMRTDTMAAYVKAHPVDPATSGPRTPSPSK